MPDTPAAALAGALRDLPDAPVVVGFSGGLDSTVLLHALATRHSPRPALRAVHVHHGLQAAADDWAGHCGAVCAALQVSMQVIRVHVEPAGLGPEAAARQARMEAFATTLAAGEVMALAHHRDDQSETFLLRALRASGVEGLAAMRRWRGLGAGRLWRPLLELPRRVLEAYATAHGLEWIDDPSNDDAALDRNYLRHHVLPLLAARWPDAGAALARSAGLCADAADVLVGADAAALAQAATDDPAVLSRPALLGLEPVVRARVMRAWLASLGLPPPPANTLAVIDRELLAARPDAEPAHRWHGAVVRAWRDQLHAGREPREPAADPETWWDGSAPLPIPGAGVLELRGPPAARRPMQVRRRRGGERITLPGRAHSHALKHLLQQAGVPPWVRRRMPLLLDDAGQVLAAGDVIMSAGFADWLDRHGARLLWHREGGPGSD